MGRPPKPPRNAKAELSRREIFARVYAETLNGTRAAREAGCAPGNAAVQSVRWLRDANVRARIDELLAARLARHELSADRVLEEMRRLAFSDVRDLFDEDGNLKPLKSLTSEQAACVASIEVVMKNAAAGDNKVDRVLKVRVWDKTKTLELLAKHFALLTERVKVEGDEALIAALLEGRARAAAGKH